ncbi:MAG: HAMP domain-containing sensor histidine kinase [Aquabacterium sp.]
MKPSADTPLLRLLRIMALIAGISIFIVWYIDESQNMGTPWELVTVPLVGAVYLGSGLMLWLRPDWLAPTVIACLSITNLYFLGMLHQAAQLGGTTGLYSLSSNAQFMPMIYVAAFIAMERGAARLSWLHYGAIAALYLWHHAWPDWRGAWPQPGDGVGHLWFILLLVHPCYILALQYITMLKDRLLQSERTAHTDKQRFLAMLSHEMRSPLQAMLGSIDLLAIKVQSPPEKRAVDRLRQAAGQLDGHLRDVTEFTRLEDPDWRLHPAAVDLTHLVQEACDAWQVQAAAKGLSLRCDLQPLPIVHTDPQRIRQVLDNLLSNAVKYTLSGHIAVRTSPATDGRILIHVSDSGIGIPAQDLQRIFDPYVRLEDERMARTEGSGLGLAIVRRLVDRLQGELHVDSVPDQGSSFTVILPSHAPA